MKCAICTVFLLLTVGEILGQSVTTPAMFDINTAGRFASLALACVHKEYPNKISHSLNGDADVAPPRKLTPAFYGCFDWHSSVHGHWMLAHLLRLFPDLPEKKEIRAVLAENLTAANLKVEADYFARPNTRSFERAYGWAWLLKLAEELREWDDPDAKE